MTKRASYGEQLKDPRWQRRRLEILSRANFTCEWCGNTEKTLHVHHRIYRKGALAWEYSEDDLKALCEDCHSEETLIRGELAEVMARLDAISLGTLLGFAKSLLVGNAWELDDLTTFKPITVKTSEEAEGLGIGLGLSSYEAQYMLANSAPKTADELTTIEVSAGRRARARRARGDVWLSTEEMLGSEDAHYEPPPKGPH